MWMEYKINIQQCLTQFLIILVIKVLVKCKNLVWGDYAKHSFWTCLSKIIVRKSPKHDHICCHFVLNSPCYWHHKQGPMSGKSIKCITSHKPCHVMKYDFFCSWLIKTDQLWLCPEELESEAKKVPIYACVTCVCYRCWSTTDRKGSSLCCERSMSPCTWRTWLDSNRCSRTPWMLR